MIKSGTNLQITPTKSKIKRSSNFIESRRIAHLFVVLTNQRMREVTRSLSFQLMERDNYSGQATRYIPTRETRRSIECIRRCTANWKAMGFIDHSRRIADECQQDVGNSKTLTRKCVSVTSSFENEHRFKPPLAEARFLFASYHR